MNIISKCDESHIWQMWANLSFNWYDQTLILQWKLTKNNCKALLDLLGFENGKCQHHLFYYLSIGLYICHHLDMCIVLLHVVCLGTMTLKHTPTIPYMMHHHHISISRNIFHFAFGSGWMEITLIYWFIRVIHSPHSTLLVLWIVSFIICSIFENVYS